jgi:hypothetical protein
MSNTTERTLDWRPRFDPRSRSYPARAIIPTRPRRRNKMWRPGPVLDQGREGSCVGHGWYAEAAATPVIVDFTESHPAIPRDPSEFAHFVYRSAQKIDPWPGEAYEGTSVLAGAKVMRNLGFLKEFRWCFSVEETADVVLSKGPVVIGVNWYSGMYEAPGGVLRVAGQLVGGHCLLVIGYHLPFLRDTRPEGLILQNSWGTDWGRDGFAVLPLPDARRLLEQERGEMCMAVRRSYGRV